MSFIKTTEQESRYNDLEKMSVPDLLSNINKEDQEVPKAVEKVLPQIEVVVTSLVEKLRHGGRLFYLGAGTSGRLGILDASECPPTFGVSKDMVIGLIAGGDQAIRNAVEQAEDDKYQGWFDLLEYRISSKDFVIGIAASGTTPYVIHALEKCKEQGILTASISCNTHSPLSLVADFPIEVIVGPEFVTGSSRMKAGTAQKLVLNMISTATMIQMGRIKGNRMVDMKMTNAKLRERGALMLCSELNISETEAKKLLEKHPNVREAIEYFKNNESCNNIPTEKS